MKRALILSDIHGEDTTLRWMLEMVWKEFGPIDAYLCLGDGVRDFTRAERFIRERDEQALLLCVCGNNDVAVDIPFSRVFSLGGAKIFMTHGHIQRVRSGTEYLKHAVRDAGCDIGLYGHTHCQHLEPGTPLLVNPGAACNERCAILEIDDHGLPRVWQKNYSLS